MSVFVCLFAFLSVFVADLDQLSRICKVVGTPSAETIASMGGKALHYSIGQHDPKPWSEVCPSASDLACDLLEKMLKFDPAERITVEEALDHPYLAALHDPDDEVFVSYHVQFLPNIDSSVY